MQFGYIRVPEAELGQSNMRQRMLEVLENDRFLFEDVRHREYSRRNYRFLCNMLRAGDLLYVDELSSLGATLEDIAGEWKHLTEELQVDVVVLNDTLSVDSRKWKALGEAGTMLEQELLNTLQYIAEMQLRQEEERHLPAQNEEDSEPRRKYGRPPLNLDWDAFHAAAQLWADGEIDIQEACRRTGSARSSFYKYVRQLGYSRDGKRVVKK